MLKFLIWYIIGTMAIGLIDASFVAIYCPRKWSKDFYDELLEISFTKSFTPLTWLVEIGCPRIIRIACVILILPICLTMTTIYMIKEIDKHKEESEAHN